MRILREQHPELLLFNDLSNDLEDDKERIASRRSFLVGVAVNLFFTLLGAVAGVLLTYMATKYGWLK